MTRMEIRIDLDIATAMHLFQAIATEDQVVPAILFSQLLAQLENKIYDTYCQ